MPERSLDAVVLREEGLDNYPATHRSPPSSAGYLGKELEHSFAGAEVRQVQPAISADNANKGNQL